MRKEFFGDASRLFSWTILGQVVGLLSAPVVTRLFEPEAYGVAAVLVTTAGTLGVASSFRYAQAIVVADDEREAANLELLSRYFLIFNSSVCLLACSCLYLYPPDALNKFLGSERYLLFLIPVLTVLQGYALIRRRVLNRAKQYSNIGIADLSASVTTAAGRILLGLSLYSSAIWLVLGSALGRLAEVFQLRSKGSVAAATRDRPGKGTLRAIAWKYRDFPKYTLPEGLVTNVSIQLPIYTLGFIYSPAVTGFYALASRMVRLPVLAMSTAVTQVLTRQFAEHRRAGGRLSRPMIRSSLALFMTAVIIGLPIMVFGETLFRVIMGENWAIAGVYAATLVPWIVSNVAFIPANATFLIIRRQGLRLTLQIGLLILRLIIISGAVLLDVDVMTTLWTFSLTSAAYNLMSIGIVSYLLASDNPTSLPPTEIVE